MQANAGPHRNVITPYTTHTAISRGGLTQGLAHTHSGGGTLYRPTSHGARCEHRMERGAIGVGVGGTELISRTLQCHAHLRALSSVVRALLRDGGPDFLCVEDNTPW